MKKGKKKEGFKITRRQFLKGAVATGIGMALPLKFGVGTAHAFYQSPFIPLFGTTLRGIGTIGVAAPDGSPAPVTNIATHYKINIDQFSDDGVCPALGPTTLRGFNPVNLLIGQNNRHLGGIIVGKGRSLGVIGDKAVPIQITFKNNLPGGKHIIPNDTTIPGANQGNNRIAIHFHGGFIPWISDGGPFDWWAPPDLLHPNGQHGLSFLNNQVLNPSAASNEAEYYYGLDQSARFGWYHDHAFGITRINAYAGVASGLIIRDGYEASLISKGLPDYIEHGGNEIPLIFQDKIFVGPNISTPAGDPTWANVVAPEALTPGSLWYAHIYERNRWKSAGNLKGGNLVPPDPSCIPEFFGDTMLVNGTTFPKVTVEARRYRLRLLNACNARFLNLQLYVADTSKTGITLNPATGNPTNLPAGCNPYAPGTGGFLQIGTEGGFLPSAVTVPSDVPFNPVTFRGSLIVAPAERPDILIDFSAYAPKLGQKFSIILYNDAPAPFPVGDPRNDYFPLWNVKGNPVNGLTPDGYGPNSRVLMRFDVVTATSADAPLTIGPGFKMESGIDPHIPNYPFGGSTAPIVGPTRPLTLNETFDAYGRLIQMLGTNVPLASPSAGFGRAYLDPATETPLKGATEIWEIYNTTADVHPMHFHLVNVQIINRQAFQNFNGTATFKAAPTLPEPNETGWKETVPMYPGTVTRIIMRFDLPVIVDQAGNPVTTSANPSTGQLPITNGQPPASPRTGGNEYVWHCHILEHEEHDMMRPLVVT